MVVGDDVMKINGRRSGCDEVEEGHNDPPLSRKRPPLTAESRSDLESDGNDRIG